MKIYQFSEVRINAFIVCEERFFEENVCEHSGDPAYGQTFL